LEEVETAEAARATELTAWEAAGMAEAAAGAGWRRLAK
jgi:hypothetical protein